MAFTKPVFLPEDGWMNAERFPTRPYSEADTREMLNALHGQLRKYIEETLIPELETEGAASIGCPALPGEAETAGKSVWELLGILAGRISQAAGGIVPDGTVTDAKLSGGADALKSRANSHMADARLHTAVLVTEGSETAFSASSGLNISELVRGQQVLLLPHTDCGDAPTLSVDGLAPRVLCDAAGEPLSADMLRADQPCRFVFDGSVFRGELAMTKAEEKDTRLTGDARVAGSLKISGGVAEDLNVKNICVISSTDAIPELAEGDVVLVVD